MFFVIVFFLFFSKYTYADLTLYIEDLDEGSVNQQQLCYAALEKIPDWISKDVACTNGNHYTLFKVQFASHIHRFVIKLPHLRESDLFTVDNSALTKADAYNGNIYSYEIDGSGNIGCGNFGRFMYSAIIFLVGLLGFTLVALRHITIGLRREIAEEFKNKCPGCNEQIKTAVAVV